MTTPSTCAPNSRGRRRSFIQPQMMIEDRYLLRSRRGKYTVDRYLDDLEKRYGGIDSRLVWHTYPNIGIDNRNQYDLLRDMPGGVEGVEADDRRTSTAVAFGSFSPSWCGTRERATWGFRIGKPRRRLLAEIGADGMNGDTLDGIPRAFRDRFRPDRSSPGARARGRADGRRPFSGTT